MLAFRAGDDASRCKKQDKLWYHEKCMTSYRGQVDLYIASVKPNGEEKIPGLAEKLMQKGKSEQELCGSEVASYFETVKSSVNNRFNPRLKKILNGKVHSLPSGKGLEDVTSVLLKELWIEIHESPAEIEKRVRNKVVHEQKHNPNYSEADVPATFSEKRAYDPLWRPKEWRAFESCGWVSKNPYASISVGLAEAEGGASANAARDKTPSSDGPVDAHGRKKQRKNASGKGESPVKVKPAGASLAERAAGIQSAVETANAKATFEALLANLPESEERRGVQADYVQYLRSIRPTVSSLLLSSSSSSSAAAAANAPRSQLSMPSPLFNISSQSSQSSGSSSSQGSAWSMEL